jgi:hypothetical protein
MPGHSMNNREQLVKGASPSCVGRGTGRISSLKKRPKILQIIIMIIFYCYYC